MWVRPSRATLFTCKQCRKHLHILEYLKNHLKVIQKNIMWNAKPQFQSSCAVTKPKAKKKTNQVEFSLLKNLFMVLTSLDSLWNSLFGGFDFLVEMKLGCPRALILSGMAMANFWDAVNAPFMHFAFFGPPTLPGGLCFSFFAPWLPAMRVVVRSK